MTSFSVGWEEVSKYRDVTKVLTQPVRFCAGMGRLPMLQLTGNSSAVDEGAEGGLSYLLAIGLNFSHCFCDVLH